MVVFEVVELPCSSWTQVTSRLHPHFELLFKNSLQRHHDLHSLEPHCELQNLKLKVEPVSEFETVKLGEKRLPAKRSLCQK